MHLRPPLVLALLVGSAALAAGQDDKTVQSQKAAVTANLSKAGLKKLAAAETKNLLVLSSLPETKAKTVAEAAQKVFAFAGKALKLDEKDVLWPGKLTFVALADGREFTSYIRVVTQQRPDSKDWFAVNVRGDVPTATVLLDAGEKTKDTELTATASAVVAAALLNKKAGISPTTGSLPEWLQLGFGRLMVIRSAGGAALTDFHAKSRAAVVGTKSKMSPVRLADVWGVKTKDSDIVSASVVEYMMYGVEGDKFFAFAAGFKPSETVLAPTVESAFEGVEWKMDAFELGWKIWVSKQK